MGCRTGAQLCRWRSRAHAAEHKDRTGQPCRSPAMANGRCRMRGGKSTGREQPKVWNGCGELRDEAWCLFGRYGSADAGASAFASGGATDAGKNIIRYP